MKKNTQHFICACLTVCFARHVSAQTTAADVETALETALGTSGVTYLDINSTTAGYSRGGFTLRWTNFNNSDWGFANSSTTVGDTSNASIAVSGGMMDEKNTDPEAAFTLSNLAASTTYNIWVNAFSEVRLNRPADFSYGTTSGSLSIFNGAAGTGNPDFSSGAVVAVDGDADMVAVPVGTFTSDASGNFSFFLDNGLDNSGPGGNDFRTQLDGVFIQVVPEPSTFWLVGLAGIALLWIRRK